jgi:hypothetical protein
LHKVIVFLERRLFGSNTVRAEGFLVVGMAVFLEASRHKKRVPFDWKVDVVPD